MSRTIRAARLKEHGQPLVVEEVELPDPGPDEVEVEVRFAGVNPVDYYVAQGRVAAETPLPRTLGSEGSGVVAGREVLIAGGGLGAARDGVWASAAVVPESSVHELPPGVELPAAAAMGVAGLTAYMCVREVAAVAAEDRVLVLGASGGTGSMIVSLARSAGATVWGQTGSAAKAAMIESLGAQRVVVSGPEGLGDELASLEPTVVFDPLGDGFVRPILDAAAPGARIVSFGTSAGPEVQFNLQTLYRKGISLLGYAGMRVSGEDRRRGLVAALEALRAGELRVVVDEELPLDHVNEAFARILERRVQGNLLLAL